jgi:hypothetical protein
MHVRMYVMYVRSLIPSDEHVYVVRMQFWCSSNPLQAFVSLQDPGAAYEHERQMLSKLKARVLVQDRTSYTFRHRWLRQHDVRAYVRRQKCMCVRACVRMFDVRTQISTQSLCVQVGEGDGGEHRATRTYIPCHSTRETVLRPHVLHALATHTYVCVYIRLRVAAAPMEGTFVHTYVRSLVGLASARNSPPPPPRGARLPGTCRTCTRMYLLVLLWSMVALVKHVRT